MLLKALKEYCANSTIHGLQFITQDGRHWVERLFWIVSCALSWYGSWLLIVASYEAALQSPISFVVDTAHIRWDTAFPAISVCEMDNMQRVYAAADILFTPDHDFNLDEVLKELAYFQGTASFTTEYCFDGSLTCPSTSLQTYAEMIRAPCRELFHSCFWNNEEFDCCSKFLPLQTEFGLCFSVNSIQTWTNGTEPEMMLSNITTGPGALKFDLTSPVEVHWHSRADVPFFNKLTSESMLVQTGTLKRRSLSLRETVNEEDVRDVSSERRRCRYADENPFSLYKYYSYSACVVDCRYRATLQVCNCTSHMMPPIDNDESTICDLNGLHCLNKNYDKLTVLKNRWNSGDNEAMCQCVPECDEPEISIVVDENLRVDQPLSKVEIFLDRLPAERFQRIVVRNNLDLVVSMGGTAGLFVGASLLSFIELVYFFTVRLCCALRHQHLTKGHKKKYRHRFVAWANKTKRKRHPKQIKSTKLTF